MHVKCLNGLAHHKLPTNSSRVTAGVILSKEKSDHVILLSKTLKSTRKAGRQVGSPSKAEITI